MDLHAVVVVGVEVTKKALRELDREPYAEFLGVDVDMVDECWDQEDDMLLAKARPVSLRVYCVDDEVDLCADGGNKMALAIPLADFGFEFRDKPYYVNRRLAFSKEQINEAFRLAAEHLAHTELVAVSDLRLFTPVTYSAT